MSLLEQRTRMVEQQLAARGIADPRVLAALAVVPRERFVPEELIDRAYDDMPLAIGEGQTISQPYIVALTVEALQLAPGDRVLEVGTGSGYAAAVLSEVADEVLTIERIPALAEEAHRRLAELGYDRVHVRCGDGTLGWPQGAPYDAIAVAAGGPELPPALLAQLAPGGRLVIPVGPDESSQVLVRVVREAGEGGARFREEPIVHVRFVPLIGAQGWAEGELGPRAPDGPDGRDGRDGGDERDGREGRSPGLAARMRDRVRELMGKSSPSRRAGR